MHKMDAISDWLFGWPFAVLIVLLFLVMVSIFERSKTKPPPERSDRSGK